MIHEEVRRPPALISSDPFCLWSLTLFASDPTLASTEMILAEKELIVTPVGYRCVPDSSGNDNQEGGDSMNVKTNVKAGGIMLGD